MNDIQEQIVQELADDMQSQIDFEILSDILIDACGWSRVELETFHSNEHSVEVKIWCMENVKKHYKIKGTTFIFEDAKDANWFTLRWSK